MRLPVLLLALNIPLLAAFGQSFRHPLLDSLVARMNGNGSETNLQHIDNVLRMAGPDAEPRLAYFLRRYRCEQLYYAGLLDESMIDAQKVRRIADELNDSLLLASSLNQVAVLLEEQNDNLGAIAMLRDALRWFPADPDCAYPITEPHRIYGNLGRCWSNLGEIDSARASVQRSLKLAEAADIPRGISLALLELGRLEQRAGDADEALLLISRGMDTARVNAIHDVLLDGFGARAEVLIRSGRVKEAEQTLNSARALIARHPDIAQRSVVAYHHRETRLLADAGLFRGSLHAARTWQTLDSALRARSARTAQHTLATLHATDAELAAERSRNEQAVAEGRAEVRLRRTVQVGSVVTLLLLAALVVIHIGRGRQKDKLERLSLQRLELERQIADLRIRQQVAADLHDDLGAGLSALKLNCELAEDLSITDTARNRSHTLSSIAGALIAGMRHILWSLNHIDATVSEATSYVVDQARAICAEHGRTIQVTTMPSWPAIVPDAELRHLAWILVKEGLNVMLNKAHEGTIELGLSWRDGLQISLTLQGEADPAARNALASALSAHHLRVSRMGGSLRMDTEGPLRMNVFLVSTADLEEQREQHRSPRTPITLLLILAAAMTSSAHAQTSDTYRHPLLDQLFKEPWTDDHQTDRINAINLAIVSADTLNDERLTCHLLLSRANQMYYQGLYDMGIHDVNRTLELAIAMKDSLLIATTYNMFGLLNENLGNNEITLPWFRLAEQWLPQDTRSNYPVVQDHHIDGNIAQCLLQLDRTDSAEFHFRRSRTAAAEAHDLRTMALAELGLAKILLATGDLDGTELLLDSARIRALKDGSRDVYLDVLPVLAELRRQRYGRAEAIETLNEAVTFIRSNATVTPVSRRNFYRQASRLREELGQYEEAVIAWRSWQREDSAIHAQDYSASLATLKVMLDNDQRLVDERIYRERTQARVELDRKQRQVMLSATGISALLLLGVLLIYIGRRQNIQRMRTLEHERSEGRKELAELRIRQRLSEEMHEELGAGLHALKLRSELAHETEPDASGQERLVRIASQAGELVGSLRQIIWALDTGRSSVVETVHYTADYARSYALQQGLTIQLHLSEQWPDEQLSMEQRRNCFLVVKEALHNIVKHAGATAVELRMNWTDGIAVVITDNGRGLSSGRENAEGNGLRNMRKRTEAIGGSFHVSSENGTVVRFTVPLYHNNGSIKRKGR